MKTLKNTLLLITVSISCASCIYMDNHNICLFYDAENTILYLSNSDSFGRIRKLKLDMKQDTLFIEAPKIFDYIHWKKGCFKDALYSKWKIKIDPSKVRYIKYGKVKVKLFDVKSSNTLIHPYYPCISIYPKKYPYTAD